MRASTGKLYQRVTNIALAFMLVLTTVTASLPFLGAQNASAIAGITYSGTGFSGLSWGADRLLPTGGYTVSGDSLSMTVDGDVAPSSGFYAFEGVKAALPTGTTSVGASLYVDPNWSTEQVIAGIWGQAPNGLPSDFAWPTLEFNNVDNAASVDVWNTFDGSIEAVTTVAYGDTIQLEIAIDPVADTVTYYLNGISIFSTPNEGYEPLTHVIFNNYNAGVAGQGYTTLWSNLLIGKHNTATPSDFIISRSGSEIASGTTLNTTGSNLKLQWATDYVNYDQYRVETQSPLASYSNLVTSGDSLFLQAKNRFGNDGQGVYSYQLKGRSAVTGAWSELTSPAVTLIYDTAKPVVTLVAPTVAFVNDSTALEINATDNLALNKVVANVYSGVSPTGSLVRPTQAPASSATTFDHTVSLAGLAEGEYYVKYNATDLAGNLSQTNTFSFTIDNTKPTVAIDQPIDGMVSDGNVTLTGTASDADSSIDRVEYIVKTTDTLGGATTGNYEKGTTTGTTSFSYNFTGLPDGFYKITARAFDTAGNAKNTSVNIAVDTTAPEITLNTVPTYMTGVTEFSGTASDVISGLRNDEIRLSFRPIVGGVLQAPEKTYTVTVDGSGNWTIDVNTADLTEGQLYRVVARANDNLGTSYATSNTAAATDDTTVDTLAPTVTIDPLTIAGNTPTITGLVNDPTAEVFLSIDGGTPFLVTNNGTTWEYTFTTPVLDGDYALVVVAFDEAGNLSDSATAIMTIDTTVPATEEETVTPAGAVTPTPAAAPAIAPFGVLGATTDNEAAASTTNDDETGVEGVSTETAAAIDTDASDDGTILGIAWYWWLLLIAALAAIAGWIIAAIRRRQAEQE